MMDREHEELLKCIGTRGIKARETLRHYIRPSSDRVRVREHASTSRINYSTVLSFHSVVNMASFGSRLKLYGNRSSQVARDLIASST
jgi:hypothetical protein